jgi:hypothetical protein
VCSWEMVFLLGTGEVEAQVKLQGGLGCGSGPVGCCQIVLASGEGAGVGLSHMESS